MIGFYNRPCFYSVKLFILSKGLHVLNIMQKLIKFAAFVSFLSCIISFSYSKVISVVVFWLAIQCILEFKFLRNVIITIPRDFRWAWIVRFVVNVLRITIFSILQVIKITKRNLQKNKENSLLLSTNLKIINILFLKCILIKLTKLPNIGTKLIVTWDRLFYISICKTIRRF